MAHEVKIPAVGESITSGTISEWHQPDGAAVKSGDILLTLETDKISTELTAEHDGVLAIQVPAGEEVEIGAVVASIDPDGVATAGSAGEETSEAAPAGDQAQVDEKSESSEAEESAEEKAAPEIAAPVEEAAAAGDAGDEAKPTVAAATPTPPSNADDPKRTTRRKLSPLRRKIATQLVNAQQDAAILTTFNECDMSAVMGMRKKLQEDFVERHGIKLGFMSFFIKAVVEALQSVPSINARMDGEELVENHFYDIGVAVGTEKGLIVPVIRDADQKTFADIEQDIIDYATRARDGKLQLSDLTGGVFTISNGGVYGSLLSTPILNPPQSGILGMHTIQQRPVAEDGEVVIRPMMYLALSYDHRIVDGKEAVTFLIRIKDCIENPTRLLVGA
jgi:2-oxoglutarate dehydrogenase E2 component (dihydrolipoamide succinyltransferase)